MSNDGDPRKLPAGAKYTLVSQVRDVQAQDVDAAPILFNDLYQFVAGHSMARAEEIEAALKSDLRLRAQYKALLQTQVRLRGNKLQAAKSPRQQLEAFRRAGERFEVHVAPSSLDTQQCYVTLTFDVDGPVRNGDLVMLHVDTEEGACGRLFPPVSTMTTRLVVSEEDDLIEFLQDDNSELYVV